MTRLYLAGPMRGIHLLNHPAFDEATCLLELAGFEVFSPAAHDRELGFTGNDEAIIDTRIVLGDDLAWITSKAEGLALLPGWERSKGARAEVATALAIGIEVGPVDSWIEVPNFVPLDFYTSAAEAYLTNCLPIGVTL